MRNKKYVHIIRIMSCEKETGNTIGKLKRVYSDDISIDYNSTHIKLLKTIELPNNKSCNLTLEEAKQELDNGHSVFNRNWYLSDEFPHIVKINNQYRYCDCDGDTSIEKSMQHEKDWFIFVDGNSYINSHKVS